MITFGGRSDDSFVNKQYHLKRPESIQRGLFGWPWFVRASKFEQLDGYVSMQERGLNLIELGLHTMSIETKDVFQRGLKYRRENFPGDPVYVHEL